jgi:hypothetical protein
VVDLLLLLVVVVVAPAVHCTGCVIRYRGTDHNCEDCLRATVGTPEENDTMLSKLVRWLAVVWRCCAMIYVHEKLQ